MSKITISKRAYNDLVDTKLRYEYLRQLLNEDVFSEPPTRDTKKIIQAFRGTKKYNEKFLRNLEKGLRRSSYFK